MQQDNSQLTSRTKSSYDSYYEGRNYFGYREWIYRPFLKAVLAKANLHGGSTLLDVGCGQGFFSNLLRNCGMRVTGIDISETGIRSAREDYGGSGIEFVVGDVARMEFERTFDCVFARSLSLYNAAAFPENWEVTEALLKYVKPHGRFIFAYNTNLNASKANSNWRYHSLCDARRHFCNYRNSRCFFSLKVETMILGKYALNSFISTVCATVSSAFGVGGEIVCIVWKE